ncbi:MAG: alpha/beta hydrolase-fold protein [Cyclobacteriaceae bacterium]|nr:MAG: alpha/beta hydrolase-fold protein [Cyclobacteriaceae bacterium]
MKRSIIISALLLFEMTVHAQQVPLRIIEGLSIESKILSQEVKYSIILPEDYYTSKTSKYPVVYLLHGLGDNESSWLEYGRVNQFTDGAIKNGDIVPMIFVMPEGFRTYYVNDYAGKFLYEDMFIKELIPFIDKQYRTIPDKDHRATMGYSMGGFGALVLPLKNPDVFTISVPLSISVRTDDQYETERSDKWNEQWGRLFGGVGKSGEERITEYYKQHSPFHIFRQSDLSKYKNLKLYIDNGDDEYTLAKSNEELHILLRDRNFPHEFRIRNGGHEFSYWRAAMPNGFRFISDAFEGKLYRGDIITNQFNEVASTGSKKFVKHDAYTVVLPEEYAQTNRSYPVIYFLGILEEKSQNEISNYVKNAIHTDKFPTSILVFLKDDSVDLLNSSILKVEKEYRIRDGYRFRSLIGLHDGGRNALALASVPQKFTSCVAIDSDINFDALQISIEKNKDVFSRTWLYFTTTDKSPNYFSNGKAHTLLREKDIYHEYRVQESVIDKSYWLKNLSEFLDFTQKKIHR